MSETTESLGRKIKGAADLQSVVRTMKTLAASSIGQYEQSVRALTDYHRTVDLALGVCVRDYGVVLQGIRPRVRGEEAVTNAIVFGSDQGLVGQFNDVVADHALATLAKMPGTCRIWAVGERIQARVVDAGRELAGTFPVPNSVQAITSLVGRILVELEAQAAQIERSSLWIFRNRPVARSIFEPVGQRLLPFDAAWQRERSTTKWPTASLPQAMGDPLRVLRAVIREFLFISLFQACAQSLASENASRLAAMERAEKNIDDLLDQLHRSFHQLRQSGIDEELFDVISGFEGLTGPDPAGTAGGVSRIA